MFYFLISGTYSLTTYAWILFSLWIFHYINRTFVYPLRIRPTQKKMPLVIMLNAIFFNLVNAGLNGYYLAELTGPEIQFRLVDKPDNHYWVYIILDRIMDQLEIGSRAHPFAKTGRNGVQNSPGVFI